VNNPTLLKRPTAKPFNFTALVDPTDLEIVSSRFRQSPQEFVQATVAKRIDEAPSSHELQAAVDETLAFVDVLIGYVEQTHDATEPSQANFLRGLIQMGGNIDVRLRECCAVTLNEIENHRAESKARLEQAHAPVAAAA